MLLPATIILIKQLRRPKSYVHQSHRLNCSLLVGPKQRKKPTVTTDRDAVLYEWIRLNSFRKLRMQFDRCSAPSIVLSLAAELNGELTS